MALLRTHTHHTHPPVSPHFSLRKKVALTVSKQANRSFSQVRGELGVGVCGRMGQDETPLCFLCIDPELLEELAREHRGRPASGSASFCPRGNPGADSGPGRFNPESPGEAGDRKSVV